MKPWRDCPEQPAESTSYFCHRLQATRSGREEEICEICMRFEEACRKDDTLRDTFAFASKAHKGQRRKGTQIPYIIHLLRTWGYVQQMTGDLQEQQAAILHDILEDTTVTAFELRERFGSRVLDLVAGESEYKRTEQPPGETWQIRKQETIDRMKHRMGDAEEHSAMHIAFGDKLANLYSMWFEYRLVGDRLWEKFNQKDKKMHSWYYGAMGKLFAMYFAGHMEMELIEEYKKYYREVFGDEI